MSDLEYQKELTRKLSEASRAYYADDTEIMSNLEYDKLYDELLALEKASGITMAGSPTVNVGYSSVDYLPKERHESPMLSLDKTKSREELKSWLSNQEGLLSWKMDGLTVVLTYEGGSLQKAVTRGNGEVGEVITENAKTFVNLPLSIPFQGRLILRGEAVISYSDFEKINDEFPDQRYKNPRNLCSGSVRQLNSEITAKRHVRFFAFSLVEAGDTDFKNSREEQFRFLKEQGFTVVEYLRVTDANILSAISDFEERIKTYDMPSDGLVLLYDDIAYGRSLGRTAKFPRDSIAFKWADDLAESTLLNVEWSASRTGLINPVAVFEPVELEGTTVQRASLHNVSIIKGLRLGIGDKVTVYKANMIIPQIGENLTCSDNLPIPTACPVCGGATELRKVYDSEVLFCPNPECAAKQIKAFTLFVSRDAMNIDGLSEMTLEKLIAEGMLHEFSDIYRLADHEQRICQMEGFGETSFENLISAVEASRHTTPERLLAALGIPGVGVSGGKLLAKAFSGDLNALRNATEEQLSEINGVGPVMAKDIRTYFKNPEKTAALERLLAFLGIDSSAYEKEAGDQPLLDKVFVITGSVNHFSNRSELKNYIESLGGKATGSVTKNTDYLINNDVTSTSSKNQKAKELGIPILSEEDFLKGLDPEGIFRENK